MIVDWHSGDKTDEDSVSRSLRCQGSTIDGTATKIKEFVNSLHSDGKNLNVLLQLQYEYFWHKMKQKILETKKERSCCHEKIHGV